MKETAYVVKGAKKILVPKEEFQAVINIAKKFITICLGSGGLFVLSEIIRSNSKTSFNDFAESAEQIGNIIKNSR